MTDSTPADSTQAVDEPERSAMVERMIGVVHSPSRTFEALRHACTRWDWIVPTLVVVIVGTASFVATLPLIEAAGREQLAEQLKDKPQAERDQAMAMAAAFVKVAGAVAVPLTTFGLLLLAGGGLLAVGRFALGGSLTYQQALAVWAYASLVGVLATLVRVPLALAKGTIAVHLGPAVLLPDDMLNTFVGRLLAGADLFMLWQVGLAGYGLAVVTRAGAGKAMGYVLALWALWLVAISGLASLFATMRAGG
jgi:hypothetical protein